MKFGWLKKVFGKEGQPAEQSKIVMLKEIPNGETFWIGKYEFIVLERYEGDVILRWVYGEPISFGNDNKFNGSNVDMVCREFAKEIKEIIGIENVQLHIVSRLFAYEPDCLRLNQCPKREASVLRRKKFEQDYKYILERYPLYREYWLADEFIYPSDKMWYVTELGGTAKIEKISEKKYVRPYMVLNPDTLVRVIVK